MHIECSLGTELVLEMSAKGRNSRHPEKITKLLGVVRENNIVETASYTYIRSYSNSYSDGRVVRRPTTPPTSIAFGNDRVKAAVVPKLFLI